MTQPRSLYFKYKRRPNIDYCPACGQSIKWKTDGISWFPCDPDPVLVYLSGGTHRFFTRGEMQKYCSRYTPGRARPDQVPVSAHQPHCFTCCGTP